MSRRIAGRWPIVALLTLVAAALPSACSDEPEGTGDQILEQIVTFAGNTTNGVVFEYQACDDSPLVSLLASGHIDEKQVRPGQRLLLRYRLPAGVDPHSGGEIGALSVRKILTDTVAEDPQASASGSLWLYSIQRSGEYLDLMARMPATNRRHISITASPDPTPDGIADLYISATAGSTQLTDSAYDAKTWASLWIGPVWQRPDVRAVRVTLNNSNNPYRSTFTFKK